MKSLPLKLGIFIVVLFGHVILGFVLYEPLWFKWYEWKLQSDDKAEREAAVEVIAGRGEKAVPYIRSWLKTRNDRLVIGACLALEMMKGNLWEKALPELTEILHGPHSARMDAVSRLVFLNDALFSQVYNDITWKHFSDDRAVKLNICLWMLSELHGGIRESAAITLGDIGDPRAVEPLIKALLNNSDSGVRYVAAHALGKIRDIRAVGPLIKALENNSDLDVQMNAAYALGEIGDIRAVEPLIKKLENDSDPYLRQSALVSLYFIALNMPEDCPRLDSIAKTTEMIIYGWERLTKQAKAMQAWIEKHKHRLAWDETKRKYYLKPEKNE